MKKSTLSAIAALSVAGAITVGLGAMSSWFTNWDTSTWFGRGGGNSTVQPEDPDTSVITDNFTDGLIVKSDGGQMRFTAVPKRASAGEAARIVAQTVSVVSPVDNYTYEWRLFFTEGDADASEYITLSATTGTSIDVSVKQPFGTKIRLVCTAKVGDKTLSSGECSLGYYKRAEKMYIGFTSTQPNTVMSDGASYYANGQAYNLSGWNGRNIGQVMMFSAFSFAPDSGRIEYGVGTDTRTDYIGYSVTVKDTTSGKSFLIAEPSIPFKKFFYSWTCANSGKSFVQSEYDTWLSNLNTMANGSGGVALNSFYYQMGFAGRTFEFSTLGAVSGGGVEAVGDITVSFTVPASAWEVPTQTTLDKDNIIF